VKQRVEEIDMKPMHHSKILKTTLLLACLVLLACKTIGLLAPTPTDTPIPTSTDTPALTATSAATEPPVPTDIPTLISTATEIPTHTPTQGPPPTVPTQTSAMSHVTFVNNLSANLTVDLKDLASGTRVRRITIYPKSNATFDILAGEYKYTITASGYVPKSGTINFPPGDFTWTWVKAP
jgi:hypothetical protein